MQETKFLELNQYRKELIEAMRPLNAQYPFMANQESFHLLLDSGIEKQTKEFTGFIGTKIKMEENMLVLLFVQQLRGYGLAVEDTRDTVRAAKKDSKAQLLDDLDVSYVIMRDVNKGMQMLTAKKILLDTLKDHLANGDSSSSSESSPS